MDRRTALTTMGALAMSPSLVNVPAASTIVDPYRDAVLRVFASLGAPDEWVDHIAQQVREIIAAGPRGNHVPLPDMVGVSSYDSYQDFVFHKLEEFRDVVAIPTIEEARLAGKDPWVLK